MWGKIFSYGSQAKNKFDVSLKNGKKFSATEVVDFVCDIFFHGKMQREGVREVYSSVR